ncbi:hypothetical protein GDO86_010296 [Hymenochirus boettgeri]|uniref:Period circadian protein homolog 2 n=1 Tax=Hymenochirus boettgeri TaxID=247094 RepID=A0A8T2JNV6_9PIPI|nr:hypothetical protein GDO86_010296 [Hymenochirus boettgeri]
MPNQCRGLQSDYFLPPEFKPSPLQSNNHRCGDESMQTSAHKPRDLSRQEHAAILKRTSRDLDRNVLIDLSSDGHRQSQGTNAASKISSSFQPEETSAKTSCPALRTFPSDQITRLLQMENPGEMRVHNNTLQEDVEMSNDYVSNEVTESEENVKGSSGKRCSDFPSPPCSSNGFSLMMADSEHNPSTSGYSSEQPAKAKNQKELFKTLKELRSCLPIEKRSRGKSNTVAALKYALQCMKQVKANEEYYQLMMVNEEQPCGLEVSCYSVQEIENVTSEYIRNNLDMFAVAVSLVTGRIVYISEQASVVLRCGSDMFSQIRFVELIAPQDVNVFYSSTTPYRLPSWNIQSGTDSGLLDIIGEKSFYCRIICGRESKKDILYHPFRMTPYLIRVQTEENTNGQLCCVLFAERVHSGYEAPRIPPEKRIFTTTHTPSCLFQDIDDRAVPLLGYLPQDLIGSPVLLHLHPSDRPLMLAVHKKILQYGGQPFDFSPLRFCARNGEYITIDTSWSSFINPWSRKVSFIIGRHKVRMGPVNEDVFASPSCPEDRSLHHGIQELTEQIYHLLMQPVYNSCSSGYGSLGSNGSHENPMSAASSSDSNGNGNEDLKDKTAACREGKKLSDTKREYKENQKIKKKLQIDHHSTINKDNIKENVNEGPGSSPPISNEDLPAKQPPYSYQQISCLDSVIRYLENYGEPAISKIKLNSSRLTVLPSSEIKQNVPQGQKAELGKIGPFFESRLNQDNQAMLETVPKPSSTTCLTHNLISHQVSSPCPALNPLTVVSDSSLCSLQPSKSVPPPSTLCVEGSLPCTCLSKIPTPSCPPLAPLSVGAKAESVVSFTSHCSYSSTIVHVGDKKLQPETEMEDGPSAPVDRPSALSTVAEKEPYRQLGLTKQVLAAHTLREENEFLTDFMDIKKLNAFQTRYNRYLQERPGASRAHCTQGPNTSWRRTGKARKPKTKRVRPESWDSSSSGFPQAPLGPLSGFSTNAWSQSDASHVGYTPLPYPMLPAYTLPVFPSPQIPMSNEPAHIPSARTAPSQPFTAPIIPPVVAFVLPNYMYPTNLPPSMYSGTPTQPACPAQTPSYVSQPSFPASHSPFSAPTPGFSMQQPSFPIAQSVFPPTQHAFSVSPPSYTPQSTHNHFPVVLPPTTQRRETLSRSSTPRDPPSPPLFQSRCSTPLQLNLLQLEEAQKVDHTDLPLVASDKEGGSCASTTKQNKDTEPHLSRALSPVDGQNSDAMSTCSDLMDLLLQEDASYGTCSGSSAISDSITSGSLGHGTSGSQTGSSLTSRSSKYFGSIDSSEKNQQGQETESPRSKNIMKYVLQDPMWLLMANADENVMMTYQIPIRDSDVVLREDRKKLKSLQKMQPHFTEEQKKELLETHTWMYRGGMPRVLEVTDCVYCKDRGPESGDYGEALEMSGIMESCD